MGWSLKGDYFETCSCDFLCPCLPSNMAAKPTEGACNFAMVFEVGEGAKDGVKLDGVRFAVLGHTPGPMADGGWSVGLIVDQAASDAQAQAIAEIASGQAGGPMSALGALVKEFKGIERAAIQIAGTGGNKRATIPGLLEQEIEPVPSPVRPGEPLYVDNTLHPANVRLALARAKRAAMSVFGIDFKDASGRKNGHFAPFAWSA